MLIEVCKRIDEAVVSGSAAHARRRMAARQFLSDRRADPHWPSAIFPRLQPRIAASGAAGRPPGCRASTTLPSETISHGDGRVDAESLSRFVAAYQAVDRSCKLGELWAIPIMLRLALIENLRRVGVRDAAGTSRPQSRRQLGGRDDARSPRRIPRA